MVLNPFKSGTFPIQPIEGTGRPDILALHPSDLVTHLKIVPPKQRLQRLPIVLAKK